MKILPKESPLPAMHTPLIDHPPAALKVQIVESFETFLALQEKWDSLVDSMDHPLPFLTHAWTRIWWECFGEGSSLSILAVWQGEKLVGILPLRKTVCTLGKIFKVPCLQSLATNSHSSAFNLICRLEDLETILAALKSHFAALRDWNLIVLDYIPSNFGTVEAVTQRWNTGEMQTFLEPNDGAYYIDIKDNFENYFRNLTPSFRDTLKYKINKLAKLGTVEFTPSKAYNSEDLQKFYALENTGWKNEKGSAIQLSEKLTRFYNTIAENFSGKSRFLLSTLSVNGEPIASVYGLLFKGTYYFLKIGANYSDKKYEKVSPGLILLHHLIRYCFEQQLKCFDFYGPLYPYEAHWTKNINQRCTLMIFNCKRPAVKALLFLKAFFRLIKKLF